MPYPTFLRRVFSTLFAFTAFASSLHATNVLSYHNDQQSTGSDPTEANLTPATVEASTFQKRWSTAADGYVYAQPLYMEGVDITVAPHAGVHNMVFVATEHDSLYALDAATGETLWKLSLLTDGLAGATSITTVPSVDTETTDLVPEIGITGTPVIDPAGGYIYVVAKTKQVLFSVTADPRWVITLFKISIGNGTIVGSYIIGATYMNGSNYEFRTNESASAVQDPFVPGTGDGSITVNGQNRVYFNALRETNRPGELLYNGNLYVAFASHGDNYPYHGWVLSFNAKTLALNGVFNTTPNGGDGGIWQGGGIITVDSEGYFYFMTGNGSFDGNTDGMGGITGLDANNFPDMGDYGDCIMKLALDATTTQAKQNLNGWGFKVVDYFAPMDNQTLADNDTDLGSGGVLILPDSAGNATHPHLLIGAGKEGKIYLVDRDNMGKFSPYTDNVVQSQANALNGSYSTPSYFDGNVYWVGISDAAKVFSVSDASFSPSPLSLTNNLFFQRGGGASISSNGLFNGVVWMLNGNTGNLEAYDALDLANEVYSSATAANNRDAIGPIVKFSIPTIADGYCFAGTTNGIYAYSGPAAPTAAPAAPGSLTSVALSGSEVVLNWINHATDAAGYSVETSTNGVTYTPVAAVPANLATAYLTGLTPSTYYTFRVRAYDGLKGITYSAYTNIATVATQPELENFNFSAGFAGSSSLLNYEGSASLTTGNFAQLTDGGINEAGAVWSKLRQTIARFDTQCNFQIVGNGNGLADGFTFCIQNVAPTSVGADGSGLGYQGIKKSIAVMVHFHPSISTTGLYLNGADPGTSATYTNAAPSGIDFQSGDVFNLHLTYINNVLTETITDLNTNAVFTHQYYVSIPAVLGADTGYVGFTGGSGSQTAVQQIQNWIFGALPLTGPTAPAKLTAAAASSSAINLSWKDTATNETGFLIQRLIHGQTTWSYIAEVPASKTTFQDTGLAANTRYYYAVRASNGIGFSIPSNTASVVTPTVPTAPAVVRTQSVSAKDVSLAWSDGAANAEQFIVSRQQAGSGRHAVLATIPATIHVYADKTVSAGVKYTYYVQASNLAGASASTTLTVTTPR